MELEKLQNEITALRHEKKVHDAQNKLFEMFINMARSSKEEQIMNVTMRKALDFVTHFSNAKMGSLFLLDKRGMITDSIITRNQVTGEQRSNLIGKIIDKGLAGWVKKNLSVGLVSDTKKDSRWIDLPGQPYVVRSALAVPVLRHDTLFGIITLMHSLPFHFNQVSVNIVQQAANQMAIAIENAKLYRKLEKSKTSLEEAKKSIEKYSNALNSELKKGKMIQKNFLPHQLPEILNCDISSYFKSALQLSGDFYDLFELPHHHIGFVVGDVSGKGVGSALFMALTRSLLRIYSGAFSESDNSKSRVENNHIFSPEQALKAIFRTNEYLSKEHGEKGMFVTVFFGVMDLLSGKLFYINGGHEPVLVIGKDGIKRSLDVGGPVLGPIPMAEYEYETVQLEAGDLLFCFTDGITEARSETRDFYTRNRLLNIVDNGFDGLAEDLLNKIKIDLFAFMGKAPQSDDITMLAIKWHP